jgi:hypothetical protein
LATTKRARAAASGKRRAGRAALGMLALKGGTTAPRGAAALALRAALEDARQAGLLKGDKTAHVSFRAPPALLEAAKRETGIESPSELGILALAALAQPDPVSAFMRKTRGRLGKGHRLEY